MHTEFPKYTPESVRTPSQVITDPRTDEQPLCLSHLVRISHEVETTRRKISRIHPTQMDELERQTLWYEHYQTSLTLLRRFMSEQIGSALGACTDTKKRRSLEEYLEDLSQKHIFDSIYLLTTEPLLFLSNLGAEEVAAVYKICEQLGQYENNAITMTGLRLYATALLSEETRTTE